MIRALIAVAVIAFSVNAYANNQDVKNKESGAAAEEQVHQTQQEPKKGMTEKECKAKGLSGKKLKECMAGK